MSSNVSHVDLLQLARGLQSASLGTDLDGLCSLRDELVRHIGDENGLVLELAPAVAAAVRRGQQGLLQEIEAVLAHADAADGDCRCLFEASQLTRAIARQATLEDRVIKAHPDAGSAINAREIGLSQTSGSCLSADPVEIGDQSG